MREEKYGSYQNCKYGGYIYRTEKIPTIKCSLEIWVKSKPDDCKRYRPKQELNEIQRLKQKIRKLTDKLADAQMKADKTNFWVSEYYKEKNKVELANKYINKTLKKKCGKVLSEKECDELIKILRGE